MNTTPDKIGAHMLRLIRANSLKVIVSLVAGCLITGHLVWPKASIDAITLGLFAVGLVPWLRGILKGLKLPGGFEITLADAEKVSDTIASETPELTISASASRDMLESQSRFVPQQSDPNLALVALRIELEKRLRSLAAQNNLESETRSPRALVRILYEHSVLSADSANAIDNLVRWGNEAAHGAVVDPAISEWAATAGNEILASLDLLLHQ